MTPNNDPVWNKMAVPTLDTIEEEIRAWDINGTLQSLHEVLNEMKRR
jgi:hypothetical protein